MTRWCDLTHRFWHGSCGRLTAAHVHRCAAYLDHHEQVLEEGAAGEPPPMSEVQPVYEAVCQVRRRSDGNEAAMPSPDAGLARYDQGLLYVLCYRMEAFAEGSSQALAHLRALPLDRCV